LTTLLLGFVLPFSSLAVAGSRLFASMEQIAAALALNAGNEVSWRSALRYHKEARTTLLEMLEHSGDHEQWRMQD